MRTVAQVSRLTGLSVRTLHHYDAIGLLKPTRLTEAGYRLYDDSALFRLQQILLLRELQFPLKEIREILDSPSFDPQQALEQQIHLLELQRQRAGRLIRLAREMQRKGVKSMAFEAFGKTELEQYRQEAKKRWGATPAYQAYARREQAGSLLPDAAGRMMELFGELGRLSHLPPEDAAVQAKVRALQQFISDNYYPCTDETLRGLGEMYVQDPRFTASIDSAGGPGTAAFVERAIRAGLAP